VNLAVILDDEAAILFGVPVSALQTVPSTTNRRSMHRANAKRNVELLPDLMNTSTRAACCG